MISLPVLLRAKAGASCQAAFPAPGKENFVYITFQILLFHIFLLKNSIIFEKIPGKNV